VLRKPGAAQLASTPEFVSSIRERKKVEMLFAHVKRILKLDRLRLSRTTPVLSSSSTGKYT
jgi:hypothetical protein